MHLLSHAPAATSSRVCRAPQHQSISSSSCSSSSSGELPPAAAPRRAGSSAGFRRQGAEAPRAQRADFSSISVCISIICCARAPRCCCGARHPPAFKQGRAQPQDRGFPRRFPAFSSSAVSVGWHVPTRGPAAPWASSLLAACAWPSSAPARPTSPGVKPGQDRGYDTVVWQQGRLCHLRNTWVETRGR